MPSKNPWENEENPWNNARSDESLLSKIEKFFKKQSNFGGGNHNGFGKALGGAFAAFIVLYLSSGFYQVQYDQRGVVLRFGEWVRTVGPGLQYILPYPFESVILKKVTTVNQIDIGAFSIISRMKA